MKDLFIIRAWVLVSAAVSGFGLLASCTAADEAVSEKVRVIVSSDIGGTDPDDFQSMVHLLLYADILDIEGLISSPFGTGRKHHILEIIDLYEQDYENLKTYSDDYPTGEVLRQITKQGETESAPWEGFRKSTEGSDWMVACARRDDPRPLHVLVWGGIEDLAQALHDAPDILSKIRVYYIGGPNKKWGPDAYQYLLEHFPDLWIIESNSTYRGWFTGGNQEGEWNNQGFVKTHVKDFGHLGECFDSHLEGTIKMGDTPSVARLLQGNPDDPSQPGWGGSYVRAWKRPFASFHRLPEEGDEIEIFSVMELHLSTEGVLPTLPEANLLVENQSIPGYFDHDGSVHFRFCPKAAKTYHFEIQSNVESLNGLTGQVLSALPPNEYALHPDASIPNWWTDDPSPELAEGSHHGAKSVSQWREQFLRDFAARMKRCAFPNPRN